MRGFPPLSLRKHLAAATACHYSLRKATKTLQFMVRCTNLGWHVPSQQQGQQQQQQDVCVCVCGTRFFYKLLAQIVVVVVVALRAICKKTAS